MVLVDMVFEMLFGVLVVVDVMFWCGFGDLMLM